MSVLKKGNKIWSASLANIKFLACLEFRLFVIRLDYENWRVLESCVIKKYIRFNYYFYQIGLTEFLLVPLLHHSALGFQPFLYLHCSLQTRFKILLFALKKVISWKEISKFNIKTYHPSRIMINHYSKIQFQSFNLSIRWRTLELFAGQNKYLTRYIICPFLPIRNWSDEGKIGNSIAIWALQKIK